MNSESITEFLNRLEAMPVCVEDHTDRIKGTSQEDRARLYTLANSCKTYHAPSAAGIHSDVIKADLTRWAVDIRARLPELIAQALTK